MTRPDRRRFNFRLEEKQELRLKVWVDVFLCVDCEARAVLPRRVGDEVRWPQCCPNQDCPGWLAEPKLPPAGGMFPLTAEEREREGLRRERELREVESVAYEAALEQARNSTDGPPEKKE